MPGRIVPYHEGGVIGRPAYMTAGASVLGRLAQKYGPRIMARLGQRIYSAGSQYLRTPARKRKARPAGGGSSLRGAKRSRAEIKSLSTHHQVMEDGTGGQVSSHTFLNNKTKLSKVEKRLLGVCRYQINAGTEVTCAVGRQGVNSLDNQFTSPDIASLIANSPLGTSGAGSVTTYPRIYLESIKGSLSLMCAQNSSMQITIYDILAKRDIPTGTSVSSPDNAWLNGSNTESNGGSSQASVVGALPTDSDLFNEYYKIQKKTSFVLAPGNVHVHEFYSFPHREISKALSALANQNIAGLASYVMVVYHGAPDSDSTTATQVSTGKCTLNYTLQKDYTYRFLQMNNSISTNSVGLPSAFSVGEHVINPETGADSAYAPIT